MPHKFTQIAFTDAVKRIQQERGSRGAYARMEGGPDVHGKLGPDEVGFLSSRDSFYMASVGETGWPYIQHRGGPRGFVRVLDESTIGFADFAGNRQYITLGNLSQDDRVALFFMDYPNRTRLKMFGHASIVPPGDAATLARLTVPGYAAKVERGVLVRVAGFDWNCPQHITPRYTAEEIDEVMARVR